MARDGPKTQSRAKARTQAIDPHLWDDWQLPRGLGRAVRREYHRLVGALDRIGNRANTDPSLVLSAARIVVLLDQMYEDLGRGGLMAETVHGQPVVNPILGQINNLTMRQVRLLTELGLTIKTAKLGIPQTPGAGGLWEGLLDVVG